MPRIARTMGLALGLFGGIVASQGPEFAQQYRQRLGGAVDELDRVVQRFDNDARANGQTREAALERLRSDRDDLVRRQADAMRANAERLDRLRGQQQALAEAGPFGRLFVTVRHADADLARATYQDFEPAMPVTSEGFVAGAVGFVLGWLLARLIALPLRALFFRRRRVRAA